MAVLPHTNIVIKGLTHLFTFRSGLGAAWPKRLVVVTTY
jgi:hypothetical protein